MANFFSIVGGAFFTILGIVVALKAAVADTAALPLSISVWTIFILYVLSVGYCIARD